jgi:branched-subunit amino acid transport protein
VNGLNEVLIIGGMALVTFAIRYPVLALLGRINLPAPLFRALRFVPPAVLTAIIVPNIFFTSDGSLDLRAANPHLIAGLVAVLIAWRTKNLLLTIILGMLALWGWQWLVSVLAR